MTTMMDLASQVARDGRLVVFLGAGVSAVPPTCLPTWRAVIDAVVDALQAELNAHPARIPTASVTSAFAAIRAWLQAERMPPEYLAEIIANRLPTGYFEVLQCLDGDEPNAVHDGLAALANAGVVRAIVTTNFDRVAEAAFARAGVPLVVRKTAADFARLAAEREWIERPEAPCQLLKIHGSADDPTTLIDTLAQRKRGFPATVAESLRHLLRTAHWLFLGYSGADLAAEPNYLFLRGDAEQAMGLTWLTRPGETLRPAVRDVLNAYGDRGRQIIGELPEALAPLFALAPTPPRPHAAIDAAAGRAATVAAAVRDHARQWAARHGAMWSALIVADLLAACSEAPLALDWLQEIHSTAAQATAPTPTAELAVQRALKAALALAHRRSGELETALRMLREIAAECEAIGDEGGRCDALTHLGELHRARSEFDAASTAFDHACAIAERSGDAARHATALGHSAAIRAIGGHIDEALDHYAQTLAIFSRLGDERARAATLNHLASLYAANGDGAAAMREFRTALAIYDRLGHETGRAETLGNLAAVYGMQNDFAAEEAAFRESHDIFARLRDDASRLIVLIHVAQVAEKRGRISDAQTIYAEAQSLADHVGNADLRSRCHAELARLRAVN